MYRSLENAVMSKVLEPDKLAIRVDWRDDGYYAELVEQSFTGEFGAGGADFGPYPTPEEALAAALDWVGPPIWVDAPVDSNEWPIAILLYPDEVEDSYCDECLKPAEDWPSAFASTKPGVMYQGALYCSDCAPRSYNATSGLSVDTYTGEPDV